MGQLGQAAEAEIGWGPLAQLTADPLVTDVLVNAANDVWVERAGSLQPAGVNFAHPVDVLRLIRHLAWQGGGRIDEVQPSVAVALPAGWRMQAVVPPLAPGGPMLALRRLRSDVVPLSAWVEADALDWEMARFIELVVAAGMTLLVTGASGAGKTTLLSSLLALVPEGQRVVALEDPPELCLSLTGHCRLVPRGAGPEGVGSYGLVDLVAMALRLRPDRLVIGEVRGGEALALLSALGTGHAGSMATVHAGSSQEALQRLVLLCQLAQASSFATYAALWSRVLQVVVHVQREGDQRWIGDVSLVLPGAGLRTVSVYHQPVPGQVVRCLAAEIPESFRAHLERRGLASPPWIQARSMVAAGEGLR